METGHVNEPSVIPTDTPATPATESPSTTDSMQSVIAETPKWKDMLPDALKGNADLDKYQSIGEVAQAVLDGQKAEFVVPADDEAEAWDGIYGKLGRPEKSDDYQLDESINADVAANMRTLAHEMGLNQKQLDKLSGVIKDSNDHQKAIDDATFKGTAQETNTLLSTKYGDKMEAKMEYMKRGAEKLLSPALKKVLGRYGQLNNPELVEACIAYGEATAEDVASPGSQTPGNDGSWSYPEPTKT